MPKDKPNTTWVCPESHPLLTGDTCHRPDFPRECGVSEYPVKASGAGNQCSRATIDKAPVKTTGALRMNRLG